MVTKESLLGRLDDFHLLLLGLGVDRLMVGTEEDLGTGCLVVILDDGANIGLKVVMDSEGGYFLATEPDNDQLIEHDGEVHPYSTPDPIELVEPYPLAVDTARQLVENAQISEFAMVDEQVVVLLDVGDDRRLGLMIHQESPDGAGQGISFYEMEPVDASHEEAA